jgi:hypothetical protein
MSCFIPEVGKPHGWTTGLNVASVLPSRKEVSAVFLKVFFNKRKPVIHMMYVITRRISVKDGTACSC